MPKTLHKTLGTITDAQSGSVIPGVIIQLLEGDSMNVAVTDLDGNYKLKNVPVGRVDIMFLMTFLYSGVPLLT